MKKRKLGLLLSAIIMASVFASGCGSSGSKYASSTAEFATEEAYDNSFESKSVYQAEGAMDDLESPMEADMSSEVVDTSRKLITTMNVSTETEDLDSVLFQVQNKVKELGGYIESSDIYNGSSYSGSRRRNACLTLRIPANNLDKFIEVVEDSTNITNKSTNVEDVTLNYVDIESKKNALTSEEKRLLEILEKAETVEDIITIEQRLSEVRYQIESIESQLRTYDNKINYSTVYLNIDEVTKYTDTAKKGPWQRMKEGFADSIVEIGDFIVEACVWFVVHLPQIILVILLLVVIFFIIRAIDKAGKKKKLMRMQQMSGYASGQIPPQNMQGTAPMQSPQETNNQKDNNG